MGRSQGGLSSLPESGDGSQTHSLPVSVAFWGGRSTSRVWVLNHSAGTVGLGHGGASVPPPQNKGVGSPRRKTRPPPEAASPHAESIVPEEESAADLVPKVSSVGKEFCGTKGVREERGRKPGSSLAHRRGLETLPRSWAPSSPSPGKFPKQK